MNDSEHRARVFLLVSQAADPKLDDARLAEVLEELERLVPHPDIGGLIFNGSPELSLEEVVDKALSYAPIALPHSSGG